MRWFAVMWAGCVEEPEADLVDCPEDYAGTYSVLGGDAKDHVTIEATGTRCVVEIVAWPEDTCSAAETLTVESVVSTGFWWGESSGVEDCYGQQGPGGPTGGVVFQRGAEDRPGILGDEGLLATLPSPLVLERVSP
jgi:hypothetical protein